VSLDELFATVNDSWIGKLVDKTYEISERIHECMESKGITSAELARRLEVSAAAVSQYLDPQANLTVKTLVKIADAINVNVDDLFVGVPRFASYVIKNIAPIEIPEIAFSSIPMKKVISVEMNNIAGIDFDSAELERMAA